MWIKKSAGFRTGMIGWQFCSLRLEDGSFRRVNRGFETAQVVDAALAASRRKRSRRGGHGELDAAEL
jgi:hypothetical protein